jgi:hypothetical protein
MMPLKVPMEEVHGAIRRRGDVFDCKYGARIVLYIGLRSDKSDTKHVT